MRNATRRTSQLANQLLALSRADASAPTCPAHAPAPMELCENMLASTSMRPDAKQIDSALSSRHRHVVLLRELLLNLVDNAGTRRGGRITVRCGEEPVTIGD